MIIIVYGVVWNRYSDTSRDIIKEIKILQNGGKTMDNKMGRKLNMEELEQAKKAVRGEEKERPTPQKAFKVI